jgi:hypothetical protein
VVGAGIFPLFSFVINRKINFVNKIKNTYRLKRVVSDFKPRYIPTLTRTHTNLKQRLRVAYIAVSFRKSTYLYMRFYGSKAYTFISFVGKINLVCWKDSAE